MVCDMDVFDGHSQTIGPGANCSLHQGRALRVSFTGELGWELHPATEDVAPLLGWPSLVVSGRILWAKNTLTSRKWREMCWGRKPLGQ